MHLIYKETLFMQKIIDKLDLLNKTVTIQSNVKTKKNTIFCNQINKNIPDPSNPKEYYQSYLNRKNTKSVETIKNNYSATKNFRNSKFC